MVFVAKGEGDNFRIVRMGKLLAWLYLEGVKCISDLAWCEVSRCVAFAVDLTVKCSCVVKEPSVYFQESIILTNTRRGKGK